MESLSRLVVCITEQHSFLCKQKSISISRKESHYRIEVNAEVLYKLIAPYLAYPDISHSQLIKSHVWVTVEACKSQIGINEVTLRQLR